MQAARRHGWQQCCRLLHTSGCQRQAYYDSRTGLTRFGNSGGRGGRGHFSRAQIQLGFATLAVGGVVYVTHLEPVPVTGRKHLVLCSAATERRLGDEAYAQVRAQFAGSILPGSSQEAQRVQRVSRRILDVLPSLGSGKLEHLAHLRNTQWQFTVVRSPQVNAFAVPNGKVVVFTGLLRLFPDDDELAVVLAHEIAHVVARHSAEKVSTGLVSTLLKIALALATGIQGATDAVVDVGMNLPFSRRAETEADSIGLQLMARACYDPGCAPRVFSKLAGQNRNEPPAWLSTHPAGKDRARHMAQEAPAALQIYHSHGCGEWKQGMRELFGGQPK